MLFSIITFHNVYLDCDTVIKYKMVDWLIMWQNTHCFHVFMLPYRRGRGIGRGEGNNGGEER